MQPLDGAAALHGHTWNVAVLTSSLMLAGRLLALHAANTFVLVAKLAAACMPDAPSL
jgi:hypothetical protein